MTLTRVFSVPLLLTITFWGTVAVNAKKHPMVRVFIIAGDGNVEGFASKQHLHQIVTGKVDLDGNEQTEKVEGRHMPYQHLWNATNSTWIVRNDVFVAYDHHRGKELLHGPLSVGADFGAMPNTFGPEIQIGHVLGNLYHEPVVIIKTGWDLRNLAKDFSSPSKPDSTPGFQWYRMINSIHKVGNSLHEILGDAAYKYTRPTFGGMVWWHGYPDFRDHRMYEDYGDNLILFIEDIRRELKQDYFPVIIGGLGGRGMSTTDKMELEFRQMQEKVVSENYYNRSVVVVPTEMHVHTKPAIKNSTYYFGNAPTMIDISQAFAAALITFDPELSPNMDDGAGFDWVTRDPDISFSNEENFIQAAQMIMIAAPLVLILLLASIFCFSCNVRRTWNTAFSMLRNDSDSV